MFSPNCDPHFDMRCAREEGIRRIFGSTPSFPVSVVRFEPTISRTGFIGITPFITHVFPPDAKDFTASASRMFEPIKRPLTSQNLWRKASPQVETHLRTLKRLKRGSWAL